ncbi:insulinase family protein [Candidatus Woesearchaeota archaeon]|nr:insulinase family protein [Candidatus Woesearchaeota archaeon]
MPNKEKVVLDNGLTIYVDNQPIGESGLYLRINAGHLEDKIPGTAHVTEHVKASDAGIIYGNTPELTSWKTNAHTDFTKTVYYFEGVLPKNFMLAANKLTTIFSRPKTHFSEREKTAVWYEISPKPNFLEGVDGESFKRLFPLRAEKIITPEKELESLELITPEIIEEFWEEYYNTNNATFCMAGEIPANVDKLIRILEKIPNRGHAIKRKDFELEPSLAERVEIKEESRNDKLAQITISYQAPSFPHTANLKEQTAIELLCDYLNDSNGLLYRRMRMELELCYELQLDYAVLLADSAGLFFESKTKPEFVHRVEEEWLKTLEHISKHGVPEKAINVFREITLIEKLRDMRNLDIDRLMMEIDYGITRDDILEELKKLTPEDIAKAAKTFTERKYVFGVSLPQKKWYQKLWT